ncbi:respiratory nitrate reductase subunit gamma [Enemella evansiae]|uniref:respiratory nitrate reductase subunit gamma n=1 Tax=Enemella evansiae TaxID=2016499 RepID=UPI0010CF805F|nr:respiratory nitrate reductase subunit gamma [Enemella evansiae]TDO87555.1 nitrate reductase gamma subunit [Enemella evansiae]
MNPLDTAAVGPLDILLWGVFPYLSFALLVGGTIWRWRYDQFGWTTRSSQLYEGGLLRIASPLFHFGILAVVAGHVMGLLIPKSFTDAIGFSQSAYHVVAFFIGGLAGVCTLVGLALLIWRRRTTGPVFNATTVNDKVMYVFLTAALVLGLLATFFGSRGSDGGEHNYRETVSIWYRSLFYFQPKIEDMVAAPTVFHVHVLVAMTLFAIWPFTRLVHAFSAPVHYLFRPYIVYRSRDPRHRAGAQVTRRGWDPIGTRDNHRPGRTERRERSGRTDRTTRK